MKITEIAEQDWVRRPSPVRADPHQRKTVDRAILARHARPRGNQPGNWIRGWLSAPAATRRRGCAWNGCALTYKARQRARLRLRFGYISHRRSKTGAGRVTGVDIDENALLAAAGNAERNGVTLHLVHSAQPLDMQFDIVVANILTNPLCVLAPLLAGRTRPGGQIALSGILSSQIEQVRQAYRPAFDLTVWAEKEGWALLEGVRK